MDYRLEVKPAVLKKDGKYKVIQITDIALHTAPKTPTPSIGKKMEKAFDAKEPGRIYRPAEEAVIANGSGYIFELLKQDPDFMKLVQEEEAKGFKILVSIPKGGIPTKYGTDTEEFLQSNNGKRVLRGIAKNKLKE